MYPRVLTPDEIRNLFEEERKSERDGTDDFANDLAFKSADLEFHLTYKTFLQFRLTKTFRVIGKPDDTGKFIWEIVPNKPKP